MRIELQAAYSVLLSLCFTASQLAQFQTALPGYRYEFPRDYFNHPDYQTEWWYYTGNLQAASGHQFGFELTFFRQGVNRDPSAKSSWVLEDLYFAHFALSDLGGKRFFHTERTNRTGPGLAGASGQLQKVWNGNWSVAWTSDQEHLLALRDRYALNLDLKPQKLPVIHGQNGVSQKSAGPGRASHYFSETRIVASGTITFDAQQYSVYGQAWMDHEFFTRQLESDQIGWNWFSIQLNDNSELMLFEIRRKDGSVDPFSAGTFVDPRGRATHLRAKDFELLPAPDRWVSPATYARYPIRWQVHVPLLHLSLQATTPLPSQELVASSDFAPSYWEGAILLQGTKNSVDIRGSGYLEMTGYDRPLGAGKF